MRISFFLVCACLPLTGCIKQSNPAAMIDATRITSMQAKLSHNPDDGPLVDEFEVAKDDIPRILGIFQDGVVDPVPATNWLLFGEISIKMNDGEVKTITLFWSGNSRGAYRVNGKFMRGSSDKTIRDTIVDCAKRGRRL
jgi:hypothetical protein